MKKIIMSNVSDNKYSSKAHKELEYATDICEVLTNALKATSETELMSYMKDLGLSANIFKDAQDLDSMKLAVLSVRANYLVILASRIEDSLSTGKNFGSVKRDIIEFLKSLGCPMTTTSNEFTNDAFVVVSADEAEFKDLNNICREIQKEFEFTGWDTPLSGSWTSHSASIDGVGFTVGLYRDYEYDPNGAELSVQLYFN